MAPVTAAASSVQASSRDPSSGMPVKRWASSNTERIRNEARTSMRCGWSQVSVTGPQALVAACTQLPSRLGGAAAPVPRRLPLITSRSGATRMQADHPRVGVRSPCGAARSWLSTTGLVGFQKALPGSAAGCTHSDWATEQPAVLT